MSQSARSANVLNNGMQSHCGTHTFNAIKNLEASLYLSFYWLHEYFVPIPSLGVLEVKPAVQVPGIHTYRRSITMSVVWNTEVLQSECISK